MDMHEPFPPYKGSPTGIEWRLLLHSRTAWTSIMLSQGSHRHTGKLTLYHPRTSLGPVSHQGSTLGQQPPLITFGLLRLRHLTFGTLHQLLFALATWLPSTMVKRKRAEEDEGGGKAVKKSSKAVSADWNRIMLPVVLIRPQGCKVQIQVQQEAGTISTKQ